MSASSSRPKVNLRSTAVKRIMQEASELATPDDDFTAAPLESDIFEWHCTMRGVEDSEYHGGLYHLRIVLPPSYPMSAPDIILMTPNGRFELGKKICIDGLTSFHAGSWQPAWGVRTAILGLRSFWMQGGEALSAIGALDYPKEERKRLAKLSRDWMCPTCGIPNRNQIHEKQATALSSDLTNGTMMASTSTKQSDVGKSHTTTDSKSSAGPIIPIDVENPLVFVSTTSAIPLSPLIDADDTITQLTNDITNHPTTKLESSDTHHHPSQSPGPDGIELASQVPETINLPRPTPTTATSRDSTTTTTTTTITTMTTPRQRRARSSAPVWLDTLIAIGISLLVILIARRIS